MGNLQEDIVPPLHHSLASSEAVREVPASGGGNDIDFYMILFEGGGTIAFYAADLQISNGMAKWESDGSLPSLTHVNLQRVDAIVKIDPDIGWDESEDE